MRSLREKRKSWLNAPLNQRSIRPSSLAESPKTSNSRLPLREEGLFRRMSRQRKYKVIKAAIYHLGIKRLLRG
tara:strand:- start:149 stop:367 length:219 start_codon:yes stop_codon:yes gene_type:complete